MVNPILFGKYHLIEKISAGGMAEVYKAKSYGVAGFEKILVIKKILPHLNSDEEFVRMFQDEANISASLSHGNIAQVIDFGKEGDSYFMAMEFVNGYDLSRVLMRGKQVEEITRPLCLYILCEVLKALDYAHRRKDRHQRDLNIVHCDVSPQNVLLSFEGEVKLTDFGISKAAFQSASSQGVVRGKYAYMSPEQVEGKPLDRRSDIFSVGIMLWELLTNRRLFKTENVERTLRRVMTAPIPAPSQVVAGIPAELDRITLKALARDRDQRYREDQEMLEDLAAFMFSQGMQLASADLAEYLKRLYARELQKAREDDLGFGATLGGDDESERKRRRMMFIPVGSGRSIPSYQPDPEASLATPVSRVGVAVLCAEWNLTRNINRPSAEQAKLLRGMMERFEARVEGTGGELWEVNHNSLVAVWRCLEDPAGSMALAVECAFGLREELTTSFAGEASSCVLDTGLHAGAVVVERRSGNPLFGWQITRTFGLARLMVNLHSGSGAILISERGRQLASERFTFQDRKMQGRSDAWLPDVFEVTGMSPGGPERPKYSSYTRYLGRESLLASMVDRLRNAGDGKASAVLLAGGEGMGRSRLREEFRTACRKLGAASFVGSAWPESRHFAYATLLDALRRICGITPPESIESEREKLARLIELGLPQEELDLVRSLFDEPFVPSMRAHDAGRKGRLFTVFDRIITGLTRDAPLVLTFEEFHHADALSEEFVAWLCGRLNNRRLVVVLEVCADYTRPWLKSVPIVTHRFSGMAPALAEEMVKDMLGVLEVSPELLQVVVTRATGNPLLIKELVGLMVEEDHIRIERRVAKLNPGPERSPLPSSELELLARRFARVPEEAREVLKVGAVVGPQFPLALVERLLPEAGSPRDVLQSVVALGVLKERQQGSVTSYRFRHSYYRKLAMGRPLEPSLREMHRRLADGLRAWGDFSRGNLHERIAVSSWIAQAVDAFPALERAGDKLFYEHGFTSSLMFYRRALELVKGHQAGNDAHRRRLRWKMAGALLHQGVFADSESLLKDALASARKAGVEAEAAELLVDLSQQHAGRGELERAVQVLRTALSMAHRGGAQAKMAEIERELGRALRQLGEVDEALQYLRAGYQRAKAAGERPVILQHALEIGAFYHQVGDYGRALESGRKVLTAARELKDSGLTLAALLELGRLHRAMGREELALRCYKEALSLSRALEEVEIQARVMGEIAAVCIEGGAPQRGYGYLKAALELAASLSRTELTADLRLTSAWLKALTGDPRVGLREIQAVVTRIGSQAPRPLLARAHLLAGRCYVRVREGARAMECFERASKVAEALKNAPLTRQAQCAISSLRPPSGAEPSERGAAPAGGTRGSGTLQA